MIHRLAFDPALNRTRDRTSPGLRGALVHHAPRGQSATPLPYYRMVCPSC